MSLTEAELDARLARADRAAGLWVDAGVLDALALDLQREARGRRRRRRLVALGAGGALLVGALTAPAAADGIRFLAQTGEYVAVGDEAGEEFIDWTAPDIGDYIATLYPDYLTLPPGMSREGLIDELVAGITAVEEPTTSSDGFFVSGFEQLAHCGWIDEWLAADDAGDMARRDIATAAIDPAGNLRYTATLLVDEGGRLSMDAEVKAVREGDRIGVEFAAWQWCDAEMDDALREERAYQITGLR